MPRRAQDKKPMLQCESCKEFCVHPRRPSAEALHWCSKQPCRAAKARHFYQGRKVDPDIVRLDFLRKALHERMTCPVCGLADAIQGYGHPLPNGGACLALNLGMAKDILTVKWLYAVWPAGRERTYITSAGPVTSSAPMPGQDQP